MGRRLIRRDGCDARQDRQQKSHQSGSSFPGSSRAVKHQTSSTTRPRSTTKRAPIARPWRPSDRRGAQPDRASAESGEPPDLSRQAQRQNRCAPGRWSKGRGEEIAAGISFRRSGALILTSLPSDNTVIEIHPPFVERLDAPALIAAVGANVVAVNGDSSNLVGGMPTPMVKTPSEAPVGHVGNDRRAGPISDVIFSSGAKYIAAQRGRREALPVGSAIGNLAVARLRNARCIRDQQVFWISSCRISFRECPGSNAAIPMASAR